jgi:O-succinylhomoserine sulfhydrylase
VTEHLQDYYRHTGPAMSPFNAWTLLKGLETLPLRVKQQTENAAGSPISWPSRSRSPR